MSFTLTQKIIACACIVASNAPIAVASSTTFAPPGKQESNIFVPFLKRYVRMPGMWTGGLINETAMRFVGPMEGDVTSSFTIGQLPRNTCAVQTLRNRLTQKYGAAPEKGWKIGRESVTGLSGSAFKWQEEGVNGPELHWCVIPPGSILTSEIFTSISDTRSIGVLRDHILKFLAEAERKSRPARMLPESEVKRIPATRNRPVRRTLRSSIKSWQSKVQK